MTMLTADPVGCQSYWFQLVVMLIVVVAHAVKLEGAAPAYNVLEAGFNLFHQEYWALEEHD
jgi:hypothetical protein